MFDGSFASANGARVKTAPGMEIDIYQKIVGGVYHLIEERKGKSAIWNTFRVIYDENEEIVPGYLACMTCKKVYPHSHKTGTSNLLKHKCFSRSTSILKILSLKKNKSSSTCSKKTQDMFLQKAISFACKDLRPFDVITGRGFIELSQFLIDLGGKYGKVDVDSLIPDSTTIARHAKKLADDKRKAISNELKEILVSVGGSVTLDTWHDPYRKVDYLRTVVHYIHPKTFASVERVLYVNELNSDIKQTVEFIRFVLIRVWRRFDIDVLPSQLVFVTRREPIFAEALQLFGHLNCSVSTVDGIVESILSKIDDETKDVTNMTRSIGTLTAYVDGLDRKSRPDFPDFEVTGAGWTALLDTLRFVTAEWDSILKVLPERRDLTDAVDKDAVNALIDFLGVFRDACDEFRSDVAPTLYLVPVWFQKLKSHILFSLADRSRPIKTTAMSVFVERYEVDVLHKVAVFLHPRMKSLKIFGDDEKQEIYAEVRKLIAGQEDRMSTFSDRKRFASRIDDVTNAHVDFEDSSDDDEDKSEMTHYLKIQVLKNENFKVLEWWKNHTFEFPVLSRVARFVHSIPACCATSSYENLLHVPRSLIRPETIDDMLFLNGFDD